MQSGVSPGRFASAVFALATVAQLASAQGNAGAVSGTVVARTSGRPLPGAQVSIAGSTSGVVTDASGRFRLSGLAGSTVVLQARLIGFRPAVDTVTVGSSDVRFSLTESVVELNEIVVTGTAGGAEKRELGTAVAAVKVSDVLTQTAVPTVEGLLNGRAPGVDVVATSGQIGAGSQVRVRGIGTFSLVNTPLVYIDGIRSDNGQTGLVNRMNDINPEEIESIEVLKGPAAATLYGTEAARGVINIITKKGAPGSTKYTFTAKGGSNWFQNAAGRVGTNYWRNPATDSVWSINLVNSEAARGTPLFRDGANKAYDASVSGGSSLYRFFVAGNWSDDQGIVTQNERTQKGARTNVSVSPNDKFSLESSVGYITSHTTTTPEGSGGGVLWAAEYAEPQRTVAACAANAARGCGWSRGAYTSPPEVYMAQQSWQDVQRFTGSVSANYNPFSWMSHRFTIGSDYALEDLQSYTAYQTDSVVAFFLGSGFDGSRGETTQQTRIVTYDYAGNVHFNVRPNVVSKTTFGSQYYTNQVSALSASGSHFPAPGLSTISATGLKGTPSSSFLANNTLGFYGQEEGTWNDRLFATVAMRVDNNSAFGSQASWVTYPKASLSWVASEEPMIRAHLPSVIDNLRLRGAYGGSGQQPGVNTALQTLSPVAGPNGATVLTNGTPGNPNLKPERVLGSELGFEAGLFNSRLGVDFTFYNDVSRDAILSKSLAPSTGFGGTSQFFNAGQINKHGIELALKGQIVNRRQWGWDAQFNIATNAAKIMKLSGAPGDTNIDLGTAPPLAHRVGYSPFDFFTYDVVSATYDPTTRKAVNPVCADGKGGTMPCFVPGTTNVQAPKLYFGHSIPTTTGSLTNTWRYSSFRLYTMFDFQTGFNKLDNNLRIKCQLNAQCLQAIYPDQYDPAVVAQVQNSGTIRNWFIKPASFAKWRELTLSYDAPDRLAGRIGAHALSIAATGRNLSMITRYTGIDPENSLVPSVGGTNGGIGIDQSEYPQLASFLLTVRLSY
jgi:TonB-linked SusC/RagA family outer membrane protein